MKKYTNINLISHCMHFYYCIYKYDLRRISTLTLINNIIKIHNLSSTAALLIFLVLSNKVTLS